jgi:hypothetical protein
MTTDTSARYPGRPDAAAARTEIDREIDLVESAARFVSGGGATRVTIGNLPLAVAVAARTRQLAASLRVSIRPIIDGPEPPRALVVERESTLDA